MQHGSAGGLRHRRRPDVTSLARGAAAAGGGPGTAGGDAAADVVVLVVDEATWVLRYHTVSRAALMPQLVRHLDPARSHRRRTSKAAGGGDGDSDAESTLSAFLEGRLAPTQQASQSGGGAPPPPPATTGLAGAGSRRAMASSGGEAPGGAGAQGRTLLSARQRRRARDNSFDAFEGLERAGGEAGPPRTAIAAIASEGAGPGGGAMYAGIGGAAGAGLPGDPGAAAAEVRRVESFRLRAARRRESLRTGADDGGDAIGAVPRLHPRDIRLLDRAPAGTGSGGSSWGLEVFRPSLTVRRGCILVSLLTLRAVITPRLLLVLLDPEGDEDLAPLVERMSQHAAWKRETASQRASAPHAEGGGAAGASQADAEAEELPFELYCLESLLQAAVAGLKRRERALTPSAKALEARLLAVGGSRSHSAGKAAAPAADDTVFQDAR
jgi:hypothetical protein